MNIKEIKPGLFYRTNGNLKAECVADNLKGQYPFAFIARNGEEEYSFITRANGKHGSHDHSILSPWHETPEVDWSAMPKWATCYAMDKCGDWMWHQTDCIVGTNVGWWVSGSNRGMIPPEYAPKNYTGPWQESKVKRPEGA